MGVRFNCIRVFLVFVSYIVYFAFLYSELRITLVNEKQYSDMITVLVGFILGFALVFALLGVMIVDIDR